MHLDEPLEPTCPKCGGTHINWRLQRSGPIHRPSGRAFVWHCHDCDTSWSEELALPKAEGGSASAQSTEPQESSLFEEST